MANGVWRIDELSPASRRTRRILPWALWLAGIVCALELSLSGCSGSATKPAEKSVLSPSETIFPMASEPWKCASGCAPTAVAVALERLWLDPQGADQRRGLDPDSVFTSLEREGLPGSGAIKRTPLKDFLEGLSEGPMAPVVLVHKTGHLCVLLGTIRVNDNLLCQVVHGDQPVSLITRDALLDAGFERAWSFEKTSGAGVPIHVGSAIVEIEKLWHNFGEVLPGRPLECQFRVKNIGDKTVVLNKPLVSCQCTVAKPAVATKLAPTETVHVKVAVKDPVEASLRNTVALVFYEKGTGASRQVRVSLIGSQRESMEITPTALDFGLMVPGTPSSRVLFLREKPADRFVLLKVDPGALPIVHATEVTKDKDGLAAYRVSLALNLASAPPGQHREQVTLLTNSCVRPKVSIPVTFRVDPPIRAVPSVISLGTTRLGQSRQQRVQFLSRDDEHFDIRVESHPKECSITLDVNKRPPEMMVATSLTVVGIWQGSISVKAITARGEELVEIKCVGYATGER